jgi:tetratricopeptide (TPR) repeat protein
MKMKKHLAALGLAIGIIGSVQAADDEHHSHPVPEELGKVTFPTSCKPDVQPAFERAVALLHSFTYAPAEKAFRDVAARDPDCAIAHWGIAMSLYQQLWEPPSGATLQEGAEQVRMALAIKTGLPRERQFIDAIAAYYRDADKDTPSVRAGRYAHAMEDAAKNNPTDSEAQIFYALALIATASPTDKAHTNQRRASEILEPLFRQQPDHPGAAHYLIHADDSAELAPHGVAAARAYSKIAPSAPHALHMPSHIFTRLGLWDDSITSNLAARQAARKEGDVGEELHAMDYLTYAYLQRGRYADAEKVVADLRAMKNLPAKQFKVGYAATAMPVRLAVERRDWEATNSLQTLPESAPHVTALVYWAHVLGRTRGNHSQSTDADIHSLAECLAKVRTVGNIYWIAQTDALLKEAQAWQLAAAGDLQAAIVSLRAAADEEDAVEKLPVTPGPIVPAREQLGELLLEHQRPKEALQEFQTALKFAPRRRNALVGAIAASEKLGDRRTATQLRAELVN